MELLVVARQLVRRSTSPSLPRIDMVEIHENPADPLLEAVRTLIRRRPTALSANTRYHETTGRALALNLEFTPDGETRMLLRVIAVDRGDCAELLAHLFCGPSPEADVEADMWEAEERARA